MRTKRWNRTRPLSEKAILACFLLTTAHRNMALPSSASSDLLSESKPERRPIWTTDVLALLKSMSYASIPPDFSMCNAMPRGKKEGIRLYLMSGSERLAISHPLRVVEQSELGELRHWFLYLSKRYHRLTYQKCWIQRCVDRKWVIKGKTQCDLLLRCPLLSSRSSGPFRKTKYLCPLYEWLRIILHAGNSGLGLKGKNAWRNRATSQKNENFEVYNLISHLWRYSVVTLSHGIWT